MVSHTQALVAGLLAVGAFFVIRWLDLERRRGSVESRRPGFVDLSIGFAANTFDTLGISSFATTTTAFKLLHRVPDERIPGTLNVGHALPTIAQAIVFIVAVPVDAPTLVGMIAAAIAGSWIGAGVVAALTPRLIRIGMAIAMLTAAAVLCAANLGVMPGGGTAVGLSGAVLGFAMSANFVLGALMALGIGLYAPCLILVSLLGMSPLSAFPIMMGSCAFLMPVAGLRFIRQERYSLRSAMGLSLGGIPGVALAAFVLHSLPLGWMRWLVILVVSYTGATMLWSVRRPIEVATPPQIP